MHFIYYLFLLLLQGVTIIYLCQNICALIMIVKSLDVFSLFHRLKQYRIKNIYTEIKYFVTTGIKAKT